MECPYHGSFALQDKCPICKQYAQNPKAFCDTHRSYLKIVRVQMSWRKKQMPIEAKFCPKCMTEEDFVKTIRDQAAREDYPETITLNGETYFGRSEMQPVPQAGKQKRLDWIDVDLINATLKALSPLGWFELSSPQTRTLMAEILARYPQRDAASERNQDFTAKKLYEIGGGLMDKRYCNLHLLSRNNTEKRVQQAEYRVTEEGKSMIDEKRTLTKFLLERCDEGLPDLRQCVRDNMNQTNRSIVRVYTGQSEDSRDLRAWVKFLKENDFPETAEQPAEPSHGV